MTPERPRAENRQNSFRNASLIASLEGFGYDVIAISTGAATANLANASVIGGICSSVSLMKMNDAAQIKTIVLAVAKGTMALFVVVCFASVLYSMTHGMGIRSKRGEHFPLLRVNQRGEFSAIMARAK